MGCNPGAAGETLSVTESISIKRGPTPNATKIVEHLLEHFGYSTVRKLFRERQARMGVNDTTWEAEIDRQLYQFEDNQIVPTELVRLYCNLTGSQFVA